MILKQFEFLILVLFAVIAVGCGSDKDHSRKDKKDGVDANDKSEGDENQTSEVAARDKFEKATVDFIAMSEQLNAVMRGIKDVDSAKAAIPKLSELGRKGRELEGRMLPEGKPSDETMKYLDEKYRDRLKTTTEAMEVEFKRLRENQQVWSIIEAAMKDDSK